VENGIADALQRGVLDKKSATDFGETVGEEVKTKTKEPKSQIAAFRKAARELGCDESEERFQEALRVLGTKKPKSKGGKTDEDYDL
jgi:hypothetical protein